MIRERYSNQTLRTQACRRVRPGVTSRSRPAAGFFVYCIIPLAYLNNTTSPASASPPPLASPAAIEEPARTAVREGGSSEAESVMTRMWFVTFDSSVEPNELPFDLISFANQIRGREEFGPVGQRRNGRIITTGLARQTSIDKFEVKSGEYRLLFEEGTLKTLSAGRERSAESDEARGNVSGAPWKVVAAPSVVSLVGQEAEVSVGRPVSQLAKNADGSLRIEQSGDAVEGAFVKITVERVSAKEVRLGSIDLKVSRVAGRQPIEGVPFDVGPPIMDSRETNLSLTIKPDDVAIIPLPQGDGESPITVLLTARRVEVGK